MQMKIVNCKVADGRSTSKQFWRPVHVQSRSSPRRPQVTSAAQHGPGAQAGLVLAPQDVLTGLLNLTHLSAALDIDCYCPQWGCGVPLNHDNDPVAERLRDWGALAEHSGALDHGNQRDGEQHSSGSPDASKGDNAKHTYHWVHFHDLVRLHHHHLDHIAKKELERHHPDHGHNNPHRPVISRVVQQQDRHRHQQTHKCPDLRNKSEHGGEQPEGPRQVETHHPEPKPGAESEKAARS
mmetsp:Transcript_38607/g.86840  ORF Transcript_38607/g.86840 Transcript_38607/m.86840 type:complete len:238 (+) Transcript_38607:113-826(+)